MERQRFGFVSFVAAARKDETMTTTRQATVTVTFRRPFILDGFEQVQPAGSYLVDTEEELMDTRLSAGWKRTSTAMRLMRHGAIEHVSVDPEQLQEALIRDSAQEDSASSSPSAPNARSNRMRRLLAQVSLRNSRK